MIQGIKVALFLSTYFPVCLRPNSAGNKDCCDFVACYFILPLKVSLFHIFLISLHRVEPFVRMARNEKKRKNKKEKPNEEKRVINKWSREDSGMLIDMVKKIRQSGIPNHVQRHFDMDEKIKNKTTSV